MRGLLGVSLTAVVGLAASQAHADSLGAAQAPRHGEAWQIVADAQIARVVGVDPALMVRDPSSATAEKTLLIQIAASSVPKGSVTTAALASERSSSKTSTDGAVERAIAHPPVPRLRPVATPKGPAVNSREDICNTLAASAAQHGLPIAFFGNLIYQESGLKPRIVSHVGARGIAQFMPGTARMVGLKNPFNPREALPASAKFLRTLLHQFGNNYGLAAAAYNAGPGKVSRWLKRRTVLPKETRDYVMTITGQGAEHWRGIRGNRFGHRLAGRMPCKSMPSFAHINDPVVVERDLVRKALMMLPKMHPQQVASAVPSVAPVSMSFVSSASAAASMPPAVAIAKSEDRPANVSAPVSAPIAIVAESVASGESVVEKTTSSVQATGSVAAAAKPDVVKSGPAAITTKPAEVKPAQKIEKVASVQPAELRAAEKHASVIAKFIPPLPHAHPLRAAKLASLKADHEPAHTDKRAGKTETKKFDVKKVAAHVEEKHKGAKQKDTSAEHHAQQKKRK